MDQQPQPTMPLADFIARSRENDNLFWRLPCGDHQNLLDEAIDRIAELEAELADAVDRADAYADAYEAGRR